MGGVQGVVREGQLCMSLQGTCLGLRGTACSPMWLQSVRGGPQHLLARRLTRLDSGFRSQGRYRCREPRRLV